MANKKTLDELIVEVLEGEREILKENKTKSVKDLDKLIEQVILEHINK